MSEPTVSISEHDQGWCERPVIYRNGSEGTIRLTAPTRRQSRTLGEALKREQDSWPVVAACLPTIDGAIQDEKWLDTLAPASADLVEVVCFALTFGAVFEKKMREAVTMVNQNPQDSPKSDASPPLPVVDMAKTP